MFSSLHLQRCTTETRSIRSSIQVFSHSEWWVAIGEVEGLWWLVSFTAILPPFLPCAWRINWFFMKILIEHMMNWLIHFYFSNSKELKIFFSSVQRLGNSMFCSIFLLEWWLWKSYFFKKIISFYLVVLCLFNLFRWSWTFGTMFVAVVCPLSCYSFCLFFAFFWSHVNLQGIPQGWREWSITSALWWDWIENYFHFSSQGTNLPFQLPVGAWKKSRRIPLGPFLGNKAWLATMVINHGWQLVYKNDQKQVYCIFL